MSRFFINERFYPQHFIIQGICGADAIAVSNMIAAEAKRVSPDSFNGKVNCFKFDLRYNPPYDFRSFRELERLQVEALSNVRFKNDYYGYILFDISEWNGHMDEELFCKVTASFLSAKSRHWKYIFYSSKTISDKEVKMLLDIVWCRSLSREELNIENKRFNLIGNLTSDCSIGLSFSASRLLKQLMPDPETNIDSKKVLDDILLYFGSSCFVDDTKLKEYVLSPVTYLHSLVDDEMISKVLSEQNEKESNSNVQQF